MDRKKNQAPWTAGGGSRLLLRGLFLLLAVITLGACSDQLLPPAPPSESEPAEQLVYYTDLSNFDPYDTTTASFSPVRIMAVRPDGSARRTIADGYITSSPRAGKLVYVNFSDMTGSGIFLANDDGSSPRMIESLNPYAPGGIQPASITLSPDGQSVAWLDIPEEGNSKLIIQRATQRIQIPLSLAYNGLGELTLPAFSPDGKWIAWTQSSGDFTPGTKIAVASTQTGQVNLLDAAPIFDPNSGLSAAVDWAPNSRTIVYVGMAEIGFELMTVDAVTGDADTLTNDGFVKSTPRWLANGSQVCYLVFGDYGSNLFIRENSGLIRQLTDDASLKAGLSISPDGRTASYVEGDVYGLMVGPARTYDLIRRAPGPVVATATDNAYWRR